MNSYPAWMRWTVFACVLALGVALSGCGGGSDGGPYGILQVSNHPLSSDVVDTIEIDEFGGPAFYSFFVDLFPGEVVEFDLFPATYDVTIFWASGAVDFFVVDIFDGAVTPLPVAN